LAANIVECVIKRLLRQSAITSTPVVQQQQQQLRIFEDAARWMRCDVMKWD